MWASHIVLILNKSPYLWVEINLSALGESCLEIFTCSAASSEMAMERVRDALLSLQTVENQAEEW